MKQVAMKVAEGVEETSAGAAVARRRETHAAAEAARILMAAGGTGGHVFPVLAVAEELRSRSGREGAQRRYRIEFLGTNRGLESRVIPAAGFPLRAVAAAGLKGIGGWRRLRNFLVLPKSAVQAAIVLREFQPDVVVGIGGYLAGPLMLEAALGDIRTLLIEPNAVPGFTNRVLAPIIRVAAVAFEETAQVYGAKAHVTGQPVRRGFGCVPRKEHRPPFTMLIMGGSQGSAAINECVVRSLPLLQEDACLLKFIHQTGERDYNAVRRAYEEHGLDAEVQPFIDDVPAAFAKADLVVSRAGATAVAELTVAGKAALLIPFPSAADRHQLQNARALERAGAARLLEQNALTPERWIKEVRLLLNDAQRLRGMEEAAKRLARPDAAERIADLVEELAGKR